MSFQIQKHSKFARKLGIDLEQFNDLANRMIGFFQANGTNTETVKESFFIYVDILEKSKKIVMQKYITKNKELRENGSDIERLRKDGVGYGTTKKELNLKASRSSIANFCRENGI